MNNENYEVEHKLTDAEKRAQLEKPLVKSIRDLKEGDRFKNPFTGEVLIMKYSISEIEADYNRSVTEFPLKNADGDTEMVDIDTRVVVIAEGAI